MFYYSLAYNSQAPSSSIACHLQWGDPGTESYMRDIKIQRILWYVEKTIAARDMCKIHQYTLTIRITVPNLYCSTCEGLQLSMLMASINCSVVTNPDPKRAAIQCRFSTKGKRSKMTTVSRAQRCQVNHDQFYQTVISSLVAGLSGCYMHCNRSYCISQKQDM